MKKAKILIVDDDDTLLGLLDLILTNSGFQCTTAANALEARACLTNATFDLMLSDIDMPGESGIDLIRHVADACPDTGIVMVSVIRDPEVARMAMEIGIFGYIVKPFDRNQVVISVNNALRQRALEQSDKRRRMELEKEILARTNELMAMGESLRQRERELQFQEHRSKEVDAALDVLMHRRHRDKAETEDKVLSNVKRAVLPYIEKLRNSGLNKEQRRYLDILQSNVEEIVSPFIRALSSRYFELSPMELQVAHLIKQGLQTKEIADLINLSPNTVMTHRYRIRTKLGLKKKNVNLQAFLNSLDRQ